MTTPELTQEMIAEAMARAEKVACAPNDDRCYPLAWSPAQAQERPRPETTDSLDGPVEEATRPV